MEFSSEKKGFLCGTALSLLFKELAQTGVQIYIFFPGKKMKKCREDDFFQECQLSIFFCITNCPKNNFPARFNF